MSFLSQERIRAVRLKGSELVELERFELKVRVVIMGSADALRIRERQEKDKLANEQLFPLLLQGGIAHETGELLSAAEVNELLSVLSIDELLMLVGKVKEKMSKSDPPKASPSSTSDGATSSTVSASPSAGPTPTS